MSRRPYAPLLLVLLTLSFVACSDVTAPTSPQRQIKPTAPNADACHSGFLDSTGRAC